MQTPIEAATETKREPETNATVGHHSVNGYNRITSATDRDGWYLQEPRVNELGVDLCPGEQKLIYCLPKEGLDWK
jgi:hypothetical protein